MKKVLKRLRSDRADSEIVALFFVIPLVLGVLFTLIDVTIYFGNRSIIQAGARDAARTVAIMGGNGTAAMGTPIENKYGSTRATACAGLAESLNTKQAFNSATTVTECHALQAFANSKSLISADIYSMKCTPDVTLAIGAKTTCTVKWKYGSVPGSALGFIRISEDNETVGISESEVDFSGGNKNISAGSILKARPQ